MLILPFLAVLLSSCQEEPAPWNDPQLTESLDHLTVE